MTTDDAKKYMDLANDSAKSQREANNETLMNNITAADLLLLRKAADVSLQIAEVAAFGGNPT